MTGPEVLDVARDAISTLILVAAPLMLVGLVVGVVISLFQALTQIQEMTLVFVPKILAIFVAHADWRCRSWRRAAGPRCCGIAVANHRRVTGYSDA